MRALSFQDLAGWRGPVDGRQPDPLPAPRPASLIKEFGAISHTVGDTNPLITALDGWERHHLPVTGR